MFAFFKAIPFTSCGHVSSSGNLPKIIPWKQVSKFPKLTTVLDSPTKQALKIQAFQFKSNTKKHTIQIQTLNWFTQKHTQTDVNYFQYHQILINRERKAGPAKDLEKRIHDLLMEPRANSDLRGGNRHFLEKTPPNFPGKKWTKFTLGFLQASSSL